MRSDTDSSHSASTAPRGEASLVKAFGTWALAASIINITVGGGIFRLPANVAGQLGAAAPLAYVVCAVAMLLIVLCFADAGSRVSLTGGPYAYVEVAFGPFVGFLAGVLLWMLGTFALAAVATIFAANVGELIPLFGGRTGNALFLVLVLATLSGVNILGVKRGASFNNVATVAKLVPLVLLVIVGAFAINADNLQIVQQPEPAAVARTSILLMFAYSGVETALVPSGEVKDNARTVPRAVLIAMLGITILYIGLQLVAQGVLGGDLATRQAAPLADAAAIVFGPWGRAMLLIGATISMFGYVGGMTLAVPRALFAFGRDGFLPKSLAAVHPTFATPHIAIMLQAVLTCALAISGTFEKLAILANLATLVLYGMCCVAAWELRRRGVQSGGTPFRIPLAGVIPWLACAVIVWMLTSIKVDEWAALAAALAIATVVFFVTRGRRAASAPTAT